MDTDRNGRRQARIQRYVRIRDHTDIYSGERKRESYDAERFFHRKRFEDGIVHHLVDEVTYGNIDDQKTELLSDDMVLFRHNGIVHGQRERQQGDHGHGGICWVVSCRRDRERSRLEYADLSVRHRSDRIQRICHSHGVGQEHILKRSYGYQNILCDVDKGGIAWLHQ